MTEEERERGYEAFQDLPSDDDDPRHLEGELRYPQEGCVMAMAAAWSVDTLGLDERHGIGSGWVGRLRRDRPPASADPG